MAINNIVSCGCQGYRLPGKIKHNLNQNIYNNEVRYTTNTSMNIFRRVIGHVYMCVRTIDFARFYDFSFGTVPTVWFYDFFHFFLFIESMTIK